MSTNLVTRIRCFLGMHAVVADLNARYDVCKFCRKRWRAV